MNVNVAACAPVTPPETGASTITGLCLSHPRTGVACCNRVVLAFGGRQIVSETKTTNVGRKNCGLEGCAQSLRQHRASSPEACLQRQR